MSEYSHEEFPCEPRANTPEFNKGYTGINWNTPHDKDGNLIRGGDKVEAKRGGLVSEGNTYLLKKNERVLPGKKTIKVPIGKTITMTPELEEKVRTGEITIEGIDQP